MAEKNQDAVNAVKRLARAVRRSSSYEEFYLECMADGETAALLRRLTAGRRPVAGSPFEIYRSLKDLAGGGHAGA